MSKRKICVVITARPSYSRIKSALIAIKNHPKLELQLVVAGSALLGRYGNAVDYIEKDGFVVDEKVFMVLEGENPTAMAKTTGLGVMELSNVFYKLQPDAVITIADRFETISTSVPSQPASRRVYSGRSDLSRICATSGAAALRAFTRPSALSNL
jgi:UDP-N-acetylglucosamine 2-epimerase/N-acetylmannosamine kinase